MNQMPSHDDPIRSAGPLLRSGEMADAIVEALEEDNPEKVVTVADHSGYIRVEGPEGLVLRRATVELILGRQFGMQELALIMTGFSGKIEMTTDYVRWYFKTEATPEPSATKEGTS